MHPADAELAAHGTHLDGEDVVGKHLCAEVGDVTLGSTEAGLAYVAHNEGACAERPLVDALHGLMPAFDGGNLV